MPFGLPLRTTNTTTESWTIPWYWFWSQLESTIPASTSACMSGPVERWT